MVLYTWSVSWWTSTVAIETYSGPKKLTVRTSLFQTQVSDPKRKQRPIHTAVLGGHSVHKCKAECNLVDMLCLCPGTLHRACASANTCSVPAGPGNQHQGYQGHVLGLVGRPYL